MKEYANDAIVVEWHAERCIHTGICTAGLPQVFDVKRRPWIQLDGADATAVDEVVARCPTGALRARRADVSPRPEPEPDVTIRTMRNGPLYVEGPVTVLGPDGRTVTQEARLALCRCGATGNPPFCDNSHRRVGFRSAEPAEDPARAAVDSPEQICAPQDFSG